MKGNVIGRFADKRAAQRYAYENMPRASLNRRVDPINQLQLDALRRRR